ncbi:hypothetical protein EGC76_01465 [Pseudidiomarina gelatinasegens]|uniref:Uncharacterized protein n=1 Tax=Pseudidiomarina gelatinasegens TaxID=2487740 RepID=A0A443Z7S2_9GAMM|nr:hypothetical protein EGC76_01465 [Pseudidiomarina gelatinasegens]
MWCADDDTYFLIECKNQVKIDRRFISKAEAGQFSQHIQWFNTNYNSAPCTKILIIPALRLNRDAYINDQSYILREKNLTILKDNFRSFIGDILRFDNLRLIGEHELESILKANKLQITDFKQRYIEPIKKRID